jgi:hypothetical protein
MVQHPRTQLFAWTHGSSITKLNPTELFSAKLKQYVHKITPAERCTNKALFVYHRMMRVTMLQMLVMSNDDDEREKHTFETEYKLE